MVRHGAIGNDTSKMQAANLKIGTQRGSTAPTARRSYSRDILALDLLTIQYNGAETAQDSTEWKRRINILIALRLAAPGTDSN